MPRKFTNNGNDIFWSSFYQQNPTRYPIAAFFPQQLQPQAMYNPFQQQRNNRFDYVRTQQPEVRGPSVWGQIPLPMSTGNYMTPRLNQNNQLWSQYFQKLQQINNLQTSWVAPKLMYSPGQMEYQQQVIQPLATNYQKMLNPTDPRQVQKYYEKKYPGFTQLSESEKQRRVTMGRYLLTPLKNLRPSMGMADLRHMINANKSFDSLYKYFKKKPAVLHDISKTIQQSNFENVQPAPILKSSDKIYAPRLDDNGNLHLDPSVKTNQNKPATLPTFNKEEAALKQENLKMHNKEEFIPRLDNAGNLHLDRAKKIFYTSAHPIAISRARALRIAMQRAHTSTNKRINPRVLNKMIQPSPPSSQLNPVTPQQYMLSNKQNQLPNQESTGMPILRQKLITNKPAAIKSTFLQDSIFTAPAIIRDKPEHRANSFKAAPLIRDKTLPPLPIIRLLLPTERKAGSIMNEKAETKSLYESLNSLFNKPNIENTGIPLLRKPSSSAIPEAKITGIQMLRSKTNTVPSMLSNNHLTRVPMIRANTMFTRQPVLNSQLTGVPMIRAKPTEDEPPSDYPKPFIHQKNFEQRMGDGGRKSTLAIATEPPLHNIERVHGNTALKIKTLREQNTNEQNRLLNFLKQQKPLDKYTHLLENVLGNIKSNIDVDIPLTPKFQIFDKTKAAPKTPPTMKAVKQSALQAPPMTEAEKTKTEKQLSLVEDFLKTKISDVNKRPSFKLSTESPHMVDYVQQPGEAELSNFFKEKELESHEIEKVDKPIFKTRPTHLQTEFLLKTISPDPIPWDKRAKVTFKLSKKSDIPGKPQRVIGMYGSLKKKKKKKKKKRMSEEDIEFASSYNKRNTLKAHKSNKTKNKTTKRRTGKKQKTLKTRKSYT